MATIRNPGKSRTKVYCRNEKELKEILQAKDFLGPLYIKGYEDLLKTDLTHLILLEIHCSFRFEPYYVMLPREDVHENMNTFLQYYLGREDYEECSRINRVLNKAKESEKPSKLSDVAE